MNAAISHSNKVNTRKLLCLGLLLMLGWQPLAASASPVSSPPLTSIPSLDLARYMGTWYEIAKFPNWFQRHCVSNTTAQYTLLANQQVKVINRCQQADGAIDQAEGTGKPGKQPARLLVSFAPAWLHLLPVVWGQYWVIDLDPAYTLAVVSEPGRNYLWILSRNRQITQQAWQTLLQKLTGQGFDTSKLVRTIQKPEEKATNLSPEGRDS